MSSSLLAAIPAPPAAANPCTDFGAAGGFNLGDCLKLEDGRTVASVFDQPADMVSLIVRVLFVVAGVLLFLSIFWSGFKIIRGGTKGKDEAKTIITTAFTGFLVMFVAYWIVRIIEFITGTDIIF